MISSPATNINLNEIFVKKRSGERVPVSFDKVLKRLQILTNQLQPSLKNVSVSVVAREVCSKIYPEVTTEVLDIFSAETASSMSTIHPEYLDLAARIVVSNHHKKNPKTFSETMLALSRAPDTRSDSFASLVSHEVLSLSEKFAEEIEQEIDHARDYSFSYFGFLTLEKSYLLKTDGVCERPQHLWMRVALGLYGSDLKEAFRMYHELSQKCYVHATPTLFNSGTPRNQLASCFLVGNPGDSIQGIFDSLGQCAEISKSSGGIGINIHDIRSKGARIHGTNGTSNGIVPMLRVFNDTARYVDQGGGKRNGSFAIYLEPWHPDIEDFLNLRKNHGDEAMRARDLFYGLWIPDLFMRRVESNGLWTLMDPASCPGLADVHGAEFDELYLSYETAGRGKKVMEAQTLWRLILQSQRETGTPYMLYKDACNFKSNQKNLGTIRSSNLCTEIIEYSDKDETAVCNLASISLPAVLFRPRRFADSQKIRLISTKNSESLLAADFLRRCCELDKVAPESVEIVELISENDMANYKLDAAEKSLHSLDSITFPCLEVDGEYVGGYRELLNAFGYKIDYKKLEHIARSVTRNLNRAIDVTMYPTPQTRNSNLRHRPIGIGVQGLADVFMTCRVPFDSEEAKEINRYIFETIYYGAMSESCLLAEERDKAVAELEKIGENIEDSRLIYSRDYWESVLTTADAAEKKEEIFDLLQRIQWKQDVDWKETTGKYSTFDSSPLASGKFQFDLWNEHSATRGVLQSVSGSSAASEGGGGVGSGDLKTNRYDWDLLRCRVKTSGTRNSLLVAPMPTASTSQILGNNECIEPITSNLYLRRTLAGEFVVINRQLIDDLVVLGLWNVEMKEKLLYYEGSVAEIHEIPSFLRSLYRTVWEISQRVIIDMAADRGRFVCQSQSMNLFLAAPTQTQLTSMHFYAWKKLLKTGMYYLRTKPASKATMFTLSAETYAAGSGAASGKQQDPGDPGECISCSA